jgi:predicted transcriptional regulator
MRTTLSIDDDVLYAVKSLARRQRRSAGEVLSELARQALQAPVGQDVERSTMSAGIDAQLAALGLVPYRAPRVAVVTQAQIEALREAEGV